MAYTFLELQQYVQDKINAARLTTWTAQNDVSYWRGLQHKYDQQLLDVVEQYKDKGKRLIDEYKRRLNEMDELISGAGISIVDFKSDMKALVAKVLRLADKYWAVRYEIEGRQKGFFVRKPVGTTYYIDFVDGLDTNDGLSITTAWKTLEKYTTVTVRSAGDIALVRANKTEIPAGNIPFDESGNKGSRISIIGCDSVINDPWNDDSDVLPIIDFNGAAYCGTKYSNDYWDIERLDIKNGASTYYGTWYDYESVGNLYKGVKFSTTATITKTMISSILYFSEFVECEWTTPQNNGERIAYQLQDCRMLIFRKCKFNKGNLANPAEGLYLTRSFVEIIDSEFGQISALDIDIIGSSVILIRNSKVDITKISIGTSPGVIVRMEDHNQIIYDGYVKYGPGQVSRDAAIKTGNANFSVKIEPSSGCGIYAPLDLSGYQTESPFQVKLSASVQKTLTVKMKADTAWTVYPTAVELYLEVSYYSDGANANRTTIKSTQVISQVDTWTDFSVTITPARDGIAYGNVYLKKYEANFIRVNGEMVVS